MSPLVRQGLCALFAVGVLNAATGMASTADQVRSGLRGSLDIIRNRALAAGANDSSAPLSEALSESARLELAAVALSSINTFWLSLSPDARSQLIDELSNSGSQAQRRIQEVPEAQQRQILSQAGEDAALLRVLQRIDDSGSSASSSSSSTSTSTSRPSSSNGSSTFAASSSSTKAVDDDEAEDMDRDDDESSSESSGVVTPSDEAKEDKALDKVYKQLSSLDLVEEEVIVAFRAFIRRYGHFLDADQERLMEYIDSEEFQEQVENLKEAIHQYEEDAGIAVEGASSSSSTSTRAPGSASSTTTAAPGASTTSPGAASSSTTRVAVVEEGASSTSEAAHSDDDMEAVTSTTTASPERSTTVVAETSSTASGASSSSTTSASASSTSTKVA